MASSLWCRIGVGLLGLLALSALLAPVLAPYDPLRQSLDHDLLAHSVEHPLGTDKLGRDILSRTLYGGRISLVVGLSTVALSLAIGLLLGSVSVISAAGSTTRLCDWWTF